MGNEEFLGHDGLVRRVLVWSLNSMALVLMALVLMALAAACSGDDGEAAPETTAPSTATATTSTTTTPTTTTVPPIQYIPCPSGLDVITTVDTDGDGIDEEIIFARDEGAQLLLVCGPQGGRSLELDYGVWYVAVEAGPDGGEVVLGAATIGDGPGSVEALFRRVDFGGPELGFAPDPLDDIEAPIRVLPPTDICDTAALPTIADADGDGTDDLIGQRFVETEFQSGPSLLVCTATGDVGEAMVGGMGEVFAVSTATGDRATIWSGETDLQSTSLEPYVWVDGWIVPIATDGGPLRLSDGFVTETQLDGYGCGDLDGNGVIELVSVHGELQGDELSWTRQSWETVGATASLVTEAAGSLQAPNAADLGRLAYGDVLPPAEICGFVDVID